MAQAAKTGNFRVFTLGLQSLNPTFRPIVCHAIHWISMSNQWERLAG